jgi:hypothetical protein
VSELETLFDAIRTVRDCPAVRRLLLDCWSVATREGEAAGLVWGRMLLSGVRRYQAHEDAIRGPVRAGGSGG